MLGVLQVSGAVTSPGLSIGSMSIPLSPEQFEKKSNHAIPRVRIRLDKIVPTQRYWDQAKVDDIAAKGVNEKGVEPLVNKVGGLYYLGDGHHRVAAAMQRGDRLITAKKVK
jgi:uncharacterized protein (DUF1015 family)